ncbi:hypothetical protein [Pararcticibacter amylolyticus]|uniref:Uncharacterized protein n=1 Tax=Pararcticibacter amylolyticus TaxID=2173175 RepID=A0A2U2PKH9_9SPHI|nr:hypothetical protein [Pararcticibacter amylolyticus]PWG81916.1 hypothetical protein DDR33_02470 [Pararcticibacter amylolyticus]
MKHLTWFLLTLSVFSSCKKDDAPQKTHISTLELIITDPIPATVSKIRLTNVADNTFSEQKVTSAENENGQLHLRIPLYSTADVVAKVTLYYTDGKTASQTIPDIKVEADKTTIVSGAMFSFHVGVNDRDDGVIVINF